MENDRSPSFAGAASKQRRGGASRTAETRLVIWLFSELWHAARRDGSPVSKLLSPQPPVLHTPNILAMLVTAKLME